jgi:endonuclease III
MPSLAPTEPHRESALRLRQGRGRRVTNRLETVADALAAEYGRPRRRLSDPLDVLIATVLSQNTSDVNSTRAFASLESAFASWEEVAAARLSALERAIRSGGLARTKARRIRAILRAVRECEGRLDLGSLRGLDAEAAEARLRGLPGVGPKTRACVLLFGCGLPAFPVDTHVHRVVRRLGLVGERASAEAAHEALAPVVPRGRALELHLNLIRLGREVCRPRSPDCAACPVRRKCVDSRSKA